MNLLTDFKIVQLQWFYQRISKNKIIISGIYYDM